MITKETWNILKKKYKKQKNIRTIEKVKLSRVIKKK